MWLLIRTGQHQICSSNATRAAQLLLSLGELPRQVHAALLTMSCLGGNGFKRIRSLQARLLAPVDANSIGSTTAGRSKSSGAQMATSSGNVSCAAAKSRCALPTVKAQETCMYMFRVAVVDTCLLCHTTYMYVCCMALKSCRSAEHCCSLHFLSVTISSD